MIKLVIFDMDGVLIDARELHYDALNLSLGKIDEKYCINREEHLSTYDGLPTSKKLKMLTEQKGLPVELHHDVWKNKQQETINIIRDTFSSDNRMVSVLRKIKEKGIKIAVASNSIRETVKLMLLKKGLLEYVDFFYSNQDVKNPKPSSEMFLRCMIKAEANPSETLIIEDSHIGRKAVLNSGAHLFPVKNPDDVIYENINNFIDKINNESSVKPEWQGGKMNVLIPMAGAGSRFQKAGYTFPKPLIEVEGKPMIQMVVENLNINARHIFIVQKEHYEKYNLHYLLNLISKDCKVVLVDGITEGAACTTLLAKEFINNDEPLLIANSDQYLNWESNEFMYSMIGDTIDAGMATFEAIHPKWSFAKLDDEGFVCEVAEKKPISNIATCGVYYWKKGSDYVKYAEQMIEKNVRTNNEFYVCPVFNEAILDNKKIKIFNIEKMWGVGTPEDLDKFLRRDK
jgi:HAD superfamily hydrolase (TIGR01509 family)